TECLESDDDELEDSCPEGKEGEKAKISERIIDGLKFSLVFFRSLIDDIAAGLNSFCKDNLDISKVLRLERALLGQQQNKTEETVLMSRQPTLNDDIDDVPCIASSKTEQCLSQLSTEQRRQKLCKSSNVDIGSFDQRSLLLDHDEPATLREQDKETEDNIYGELEDGEDNEKGKLEIKQADDQFEKKYELLKSASLDSVVIEVKSESVSRPQPLTQETRGLSASEPLLN
ncbi:piezo-type mechanosensitive ion channel component 2-like, partial [Clarias magur]